MCFITDLFFSENFQSVTNMCDENNKNEKIERIFSFYQNAWLKYEKLRPYLDYAWSQVVPEIFNTNTISFYV